jgi:hypothetical protein
MNDLGFYINSKNPFITTLLNRFNNFQPVILKANGVRYLEFSENRIARASSFPALDPSGHVVDLEHIDTLVMKNVATTEGFQNNSKAINLENQEIDKKYFRKDYLLTVSL